MSVKAWAWEYWVCQAKDGLFFSIDKITYIKYR